MKTIGGDFIQSNGFEFPSFEITNERISLVHSVWQFLGMEISALKLDAEPDDIVQVHLSFYLDKESPHYEAIVNTLRQAYQSTKE